MPSYSLVPTIAQEMGLSALGTFHERQGDQSLLAGDGAFAAAWARTFGDKREQRGDQIVAGTDFQLAPRFDGDIWGIQAGVDLYAREYGDGRQNRFGLFYTHSEASGATRGNVLARINDAAGLTRLNADSGGVYATYIGAGRWYADLVAMYSWLSGRGSSYRGISADFEGESFLFSAEGGYPIAIADSWTVEPQAQFVIQNVSIDPSSDLFSEIRFDDVTTYTGRIGARIEGQAEIESTIFQPFVNVDIWHTFAGTTEIFFNDAALKTNSGATTLKVGGGYTAILSPGISLHAGVDWGTNLNGSSYDTIGANVGLRITW